MTPADFDNWLAAMVMSVMNPPSEALQQQQAAEAIKADGARVAG